MLSYIAAVLPVLERLLNLLKPGFAVLLVYLQGKRDAMAKANEKELKNAQKAQKQKSDIASLSDDELNSGL